MATIPSLALIPSGYKASKVYSVLPTDGVGDFDFTRSGNATRVNSEGLIELVTTNVPRLNYPLIDGVVNGCPSLLLEPSRTNLVTYSEDFSNAYWTKVGASITSNAAISPDGTLNADKLVEGSGTGAHLVSRALFGSGVNLAKYTLSIFAKKGERDLLVIQDGTTVNNAFFDLTNGVVAGITGAGTAKIESLGNDFYRCSFTFTQSGVDLRPQFALADITLSGSPPSYTGDGTSGIYIYGAQLEEGSYPTSYIPSLTGSQTTRSAETCNNAGDASTFNDSEGVLFAEISSVNDGQYKFIGISDGTNSNRLGLFIGNSNNKMSVESVGSGTNLGIYDKDIVTENTNKIVIKYKTNNCSLWVNGFEIGVDTSFAAFTNGTLTELSFYRGDNNFNFYGSTKQIQYYDSALNDSDLETLTSWTSFSEMATSQLYTIE